MLACNHLLMIALFFSSTERGAPPVEHLERLGFSVWGRGFVVWCLVLGAWCLGQCPEFPWAGKIFLGRFLPPDGALHHASVWNCGLANSP